MSSRVPAPAQRLLPDAPGHPGLPARLKSRRNPWKRPTGPGRPHLAKARGETSATLPAAGKPLAGSVSDPLMALGGWVGALAPHEAAPRSPAHRGRQRQKPSCRGQKTKRKYKSTHKRSEYSPRPSARTLNSGLPRPFSTPCSAARTGPLRAPEARLQSQFYHCMQLLQNSEVQSAVRLRDFKPASLTSSYQRQCRD